MDINEPQTNGQVEVLGCEGSGGGSQPSLDRFDRIDFSGIFKNVLPRCALWKWFKSPTTRCER